VVCTANPRSGADTSRPCKCIGWRLGISSLYVGEGGIGSDEDDDPDRGGRTSGGGGVSQGAGSQSTLKSSPSPHPMSST
jgi:hypothetical protein